MAITTMDGLVTAMPGQHKHFTKNGTAAKAAGAWQSLWTATGQPGPATYPGASLAWSVLTSATAGAFTFVNGGALLGYLGRIAAGTTVPGTLILYDRLAQTGAISTTVTTPQTLTGGPTLTRPDALGADVEPWFEWITASGAGASSINISSYTDQDGNTGNVGGTTAVPNPSVLGQMQPLPLAAGDTGVRAVASFTNSITTTSGTGQVVLLRRIAEVPLTIAGVGSLTDAFGAGMPRIYDDSCLALMYQASATTAATFQGALSIVQG